MIGKEEGRRAMKKVPELQNQQGVAAIIIAALLTALLGFAALAVDVGYFMVARNQLQDVSDAAALAAGRQLGRMYEGMTYAEQQNFVPDSGQQDLIRTAATGIAFQNSAGETTNTVMNTADVLIGRWDSATRTFTDGANPPNAVKVAAKKDGSANPPLSTFFAKVFTIDSMNVRARATAALTGSSDIGAGGLPVPFGISYAWFLGDFCDQNITFYPSNTSTSCAGWHNYTDSPAADSKIRQKINDEVAGTWQSPETSINTYFNFSGGTLSNNTFDAFTALFNQKKDSVTGTWTTTVPVYDWTDCSNPQGAIKIIGFATIVITNVSGPPSHTISGHVVCNTVDPGRGGGVTAGKVGSIPGLVE